MALWGNNDNRDAQGTLTLDYATGICTGSNLESPGAGTSFGATGSIQEGDIIRFGDRVKGGSKVYFGEAIVVSVASTTQLTIGSTANLSGVAIAATAFSASQSPKWCVTDSSFSEAQAQNHGYSKLNYGVASGGASDANSTVYETGVGWVGVTTYLDSEGDLRVKKEILVAMSGITTGNVPSYPNIEDAV